MVLGMDKRELLSKVTKL